MASSYCEIATLQAEPWPVEIRTDSRYVMRGVDNIASLRRRGWLEVDNGDLWERLDGILLKRDANSVSFVKVKGHATWSDVRSGAVEWSDKRGNDAADVLARRGAKAHVIDEAFASRVRGTRRVAGAVQAMMADIVAARNGHRAASAGVFVGEDCISVSSDDCDTVFSDDCVSVCSDDSGDGGVIDVTDSDESEGVRSPACNEDGWRLEPSECRHFNSMGENMWKFGGEYGW